MSASIVVTDEHQGERLDVFVAHAEGISRARAGLLIDGGSVSVNDRAQRKSYRLAASDVVQVTAPRAAAPAPPPQGVEIVHEDEHLMVVFKPAGVVVHKAAGVHDGTLVDALLAAGKELAPGAGVDRPGIVHRLDRDVSGLLIVAKTDEAHEQLVAAMASRSIERRYIALVHGVPTVDRGKIDAPVGRHPRHRTRMAVVPEGRPAVTWFVVNERFSNVSLLEVRLETGRTHQIRTHLASIGHAVVGDEAYGRDPAVARGLGVERPFLHAYRLSFLHPVGGDRLEFESELPVELADVLDRLRVGS
jgi:23S rRNA pseudouridine1911/1915/1917 synthase